MKPSMNDSGGECGSVRVKLQEVWLDLLAAGTWAGPTTTLSMASATVAPMTECGRGVPRAKQV